MVVPTGDECKQLKRKTRLRRVKTNVSAQVSYVNEPSPKLRPTNTYKINESVSPVGDQNVVSKRRLILRCLKKEGKLSLIFPLISVSVWFIVVLVTSRASDF